MRWLELTVETDVEAVEAVSEILGRVGAGTAVQPTRLIRDPDDELVARDDPTAPYIITAHVADAPGAAARVESTERALWHLQAFGLRPVGPLRVRPVDDAAWADAWKVHYVAQRIGRVVVVPSWAEEELRAGEVGITLDPGMAFGTGLHPTTRGCLELLAKLLGELNDTTVSLLVSPEWQAIQQALATVLTPYPEVARQVALALRRASGDGAAAALTNGRAREPRR